MLVKDKTLQNNAKLSHHLLDFIFLVRSLSLNGYKDKAMYLLSWLL